MRKQIWAWLLAITVLAGLLITCSSSIYDFLAVTTCRVEADIVVVEGWVPDYVVKAAADEFSRGGYRCIVTSGLESETGLVPGPHNSVAIEAAVLLQQSGIDRSRILICATPPTNWNRTAKSARAVRDILSAQGVNPKNINIVTIGVHARRTWLAYQHAFGPGTQIGIIQIPEHNLDPARWWASGLGIKRVTKGYIAWLREYIFGTLL